MVIEMVVPGGSMWSGIVISGGSTSTMVSVSGSGSFSSSKRIYVNAVVVGLLFAVLINPVFTEAVYSEATTALAILSLFICIALKRSPLELVSVMTGAAYICHLLEWI